MKHTLILYKHFSGEFSKKSQEKVAVLPKDLRPKREVRCLAPLLVNPDPQSKPKRDSDDPQSKREDLDDYAPWKFFNGSVLYLGMSALLVERHPSSCNCHICWDHEVGLESIAITVQPDGGIYVQGRVNPAMFVDLLALNLAIFCATAIGYSGIVCYEYLDDIHDNWPL